MLFFVKHTASLFYERKGGFVYEWLYIVLGEKELKSEQKNQYFIYADYAPLSYFV